MYGDDFRHSRHTLGGMKSLIQLALDEDAVHRDLTARATIAADARGTARITAKAPALSPARLLPAPCSLPWMSIYRAAG